MMCLCVSVNLSAGAQGGQRLGVLLELELQVDANHLLWVLGTELVRTVLVLTPRAFSPALWSLVTPLVGA